MNFKDEMKQKVAQIEIILDEYLPAQEGLQKTVLTAMNTTVKAGGKRLRPMLINETYQMFGSDQDSRQQTWNLWNDRWAGCRC